MVFDTEEFTRVILQFLRASVKNASEIEETWSQMQRCISNMDDAVKSFTRREQNKVDMGEPPQPVDLGTGKCSSTIVNPGGCGATIKSVEEIQGDRRKKWADISSSKKRMRSKTSPINADYNICMRCYKLELKQKMRQALHTINQNCKIKIGQSHIFG